MCKRWLSKLSHVIRINMLLYIFKHIFCFFKWKHWIKSLTFFFSVCLKFSNEPYALLCAGAVYHFLYCLWNEKSGTFFFFYEIYGFGLKYTNFQKHMLIYGIFYKLSLSSNGDVSLLLLNAAWLKGAISVCFFGLKVYSYFLVKATFLFLFFFFQLELKKNFNFKTQKFKPDSIS